MSHEQMIDTAKFEADELDLFADEVQDRSNALIATVFCLSTDGCFCSLSSFKPA